MKKLLAFLLAAASAASMAVTALAQPASEADTVQAAAEPALLFGADEETGKQLGDLLMPGTTYQFPLSLVDGSGSAAPLTEEDLKENRFTIRNTRGEEAMTSFKVVNGDDGYVLEAVTAAGWPTEQTTVAYTIQLKNKATGRTLVSQTARFSVGYDILPDAAVEAAADDAYVQVDPAAPVVTQNQFERMDDILRGEAVTLYGDNWYFTVRVTEQSDLNLVHNENAIKEVAQMFEEQDFKFLSFPAGPRFDFTGTMVIDVEEEAFEEAFVYRYYKGVLTRLDAEYDTDLGTVSFETKRLGRFVVTNKEIPDGTVVEEGFHNVDDWDV